MESSKAGGPDKLTLGAFALSVLLAGANAVAVRFTVAELAPLWGAAIRFAGAALFFWAIMLIRRAPLPAGRNLAGVLLYGLLTFGAGYAFAYWGLAYVQAGLAQVILALVPLLTFFFAFAHGMEPFRWRGLLGAILAVAGIAIAFAGQPRAGVPLLALLALVAGAACFAEATVVAKRFPRADPISTNAIAMTAGTGLLLAVSLASGEAWQWPARPATWSAILYLIFLGSVVVFYLFLLVVRRWTASATSYQFVLLPFVTVVIAAWLAKEKVTPGFLLGGLLVLAGVWVGAFTQSISRRQLDS